MEKDPLDRWMDRWLARQERAEQSDEGEHQKGKCLECGRELESGECPECGKRWE